MRGYPFQALLRDYPTWVAVLVMSAIFAAFHNANPSFSWLAFLNTFIAGIWLSIAYLKNAFVVAGDRASYRLEFCDGCSVQIFG